MILREDAIVVVAAVLACQRQPTTTTPRPKKDQWQCRACTALAQTHRLQSSARLLMTTTTMQKRKCPRATRSSTGVPPPNENHTFDLATLEQPPRASIASPCWIAHRADQWCRSQWRWLRGKPKKHHLHWRHRRMTIEVPRRNQMRIRQSSLNNQE